MTEHSMLVFLLGVAFILAPFMTQKFFLKTSRAYSVVHGISLITLLIAVLIDLNWMTMLWPLFCVYGFFLYLKQERWLIFSATGLASCIPFVFSLVSSVWFFTGSNNLHLLGYNQTWSFYAALHGCILGWFFVGCLAHLSKRPGLNKVYLFGCYLSLILFLFIAFGIDGIPYIKRLGVLGFSTLVPFLISLFIFDARKGDRLSLLFASISLLSIASSMMIAMLNEFWTSFPKIVFGIPLMTFTHGLINALSTVPCFYLAIRLSDEDSCDQAAERDIIFFDGLCVLCNGTVTRLLGIDKKRTLRYSSLQGECAKRCLNLHHPELVESVVFFRRGHIYEKSEAVIQILCSLGGVYKLGAMFLDIFPLGISNSLYDIIARNRYRLFGKKEACLLPNERDRDLFIP